MTCRAAPEDAGIAAPCPPLASRLLRFLHTNPSPLLSPPAGRSFSPPLRAPAVPPAGRTGARLGVGWWETPEKGAFAPGVPAATPLLGISTPTTPTSGPGGSRSGLRVNGEE